MTGSIFPTGGSQSFNLGELDLSFNPQEFQELMKTFDADLSEFTAESTPVDAFAQTSWDSGTDYSTDFGSGYQTPQDVVPAQPNFPGPPPPPLQVQPLYHPSVGWYYPVTQPMGPTTQPMQMQMLTQGYMVPGAVSAPPARTPTPFPALTSVPFQAATSAPRDFSDDETDAPAKRKALKPKRNGKERTHGPAAFMKAKANRELGIEEPASPELHGSALAKRENKARTNAMTQICVCKPEQRQIKRPKNAFILFRCAMMAKIQQQVGLDHAQVSKKAGEMWHNASPEVKAKYQALAAKEKKKHAELYPNYSYNPGQKAKRRFGSAGCTCGALEANLDALKRGKGTSEAPIEIDDDQPEESDAYVPPRHMSSSRRQYQAPPAQMTQPAAAEMPDLSALGIPEAQQLSAIVEYNRTHRKRKATADPDAEQPIAKRRSSRAAAKHISYAEPDEDDMLDSIEAPEKRARDSRTKRPSTPLSPVNSEDFRLASGGPAMRTRSKSLTPDQAAEIPRFNSLDDAMWDDLFNDALDEAEDDDEIVVSTRKSRRDSRRSSRNCPKPVRKGLALPTASASKN